MSSLLPDRKLLCRITKPIYVPAERLEHVALKDNVASIANENLFVFVAVRFDIAQEIVPAIIYGLPDDFKRLKL